jgi:hypothetical protein
VTVMRQVSNVERRARLARRHRLLPDLYTDEVAEIARSMVALHSSDPSTVYLSAAARMVNPSIAAVEEALYEHRSVVRHHAMRRTLWVFDHDTARLAHVAATLDLVGPERRRFAGMIESTGVTTDGQRWYDDARADVLAALRSCGTASTRELGELVPALRVPIALGVGTKYEATQAAHTRVLLLLGFEGVIIRVRPTGSWINGQYRWTAADSWLPGGLATERHDVTHANRAGADVTLIDVAEQRAVERSARGGRAEPGVIPGGDDRGAAGSGDAHGGAAASELVRRWLYAFGPATTGDVQWWFGWTVAKTNRALVAAGAVAVGLEGGSNGWLSSDDVEPVESVEPWVALLPGLDPTTMGWKQRDWYLDPTLVPAVFDRNGNGGPAIWIDGRIVGGWVQRKDGHIATQLLADPGRDVTAAVEQAAANIEQLVGDTRFTVRFPSPMQAALLM